MWSVIDTVFSNYGREFGIAESLCRLIRNIFESYHTHAAPIVPLLAPRLLSTYLEAGLPCYLWAASHIVEACGDTESLTPVISPMIEKMAISSLQVIQAQSQVDVDELVEEFFYLMLRVVKNAERTVTPNLLESSIQCAIFCCSIASPSSLAGILQYIQLLIEEAASSSPAGQHMKQMLTGQIVQLSDSIFKGLLQTFSRDRMIVDDISSILEALYVLIGGQMIVQATNQALSQYPESTLTGQQRTVFLEKFSR